MKNISLLLFFSLFICRLQAQKVEAPVNLDGKLDTSFTFLVYGGPPNLTYENAKYVVAKKWGFHYISIAQCMVEKEIKDSADKKNIETERRVELKYGKDWQVKFNKEIDKEIARQKTISSLLDKEKRIIQKQNQLEKEGNGLHYSFNPIAVKQYYVSVEGWGKINDSDVWVSYFRYLVDLRKKEVHLVSDSIFNPYK